MTTSYPANIDNSITLPSSTDNLTPVSASVFNNLRGALLAVETELGVKPSGVYSTVRARLDVLDTTIGNLHIISLAKDLGGTLTQPLVIGIQGRPLSNVAPMTGQVIAWNGIAWVPANVQSGSSVVIFSGDLAGTPTVQRVIGIQDVPVSDVAPTLNQVLQYNGSQLVFATLPTSSFTAGGDLSGSSSSQTVIRINGTTITTAGSTGQILQMTGAGTAGYAAVNLGTAASITGVLPIANQANQTMGGDVTGTTATSVVAKIHGATVPIAGSLTTGNVLQVSGSSAVSYGAVDLTSSNAVSGLLPTAHQASQSMGGDVTGTTAAATVVKLQGNAVKSGALGSTQDGYVLTWVNASNDWEAKTVSGFAPTNTAFGVYGDGSDGTAVCDGAATVAGMSRVGSVYTLIRDVYFANLTVNSGVTIMGNGWRLFVNGNLTMNGHFSVDGGNAAAISSPGGGPAFSAGAKLGRGADGTNAGNGEDSTFSFGGNGGNCSFGTIGGTSAPPTVEYGSPRDIFSAIGGYLHSGTGNGTLLLNGGASGAGDGPGGAGGAGGGVIIIAANTLIGSGQITANGGNGGSLDGTTFTGGGGGGYINLITRNKASWLGTLAVNGGSAGGAGSTAGTAGLIISTIVV